MGEGDARPAAWRAGVNQAPDPQEGAGVDLGAESASPDPFDDRISESEGGLRQRTARGTIINAAFLIGVAALGLLQRILVAVFLTPTELGVWGAVLMTLLTVLFIKNAGIGDKFVQQAEHDQEKAFQKAFTIDLILAGACVAVSIAALPIFALAYGEWQIVVPGLVLTLAILGNSLQAPVWIFYRQMDFLRQRLIQAVDPCVTFAATIALAIAGAGYWSLVVGAVAGAWAGGIVSLRMCPYRLGLRYDRRTFREYFSFSWPVVAANGSGVVVGQGSLLVGTRTAGLAGAGAIGLASSIGAFTRGVDSVVTQALYPAICAVRHRADLLFESFVKSNRLALIWGVPFGVGIALFASDLIAFVIGEKWRFAVAVLQAFGIVAAIEQLGFNWTAFLRARGDTRPLAVLAVVSLVAFAVVTAPLLIAFGLQGFAVGWIAWGLITLAGRTYFLARMFAGFSMWRHALRAMAPSVPAIAVVLLARAATGGDRTLAIALAELGLYVAITAGTTVLVERALLREVVGYVRRKADVAT